MKNQLSKSDKIKIMVRKHFQQVARKQINDVQVGDMTMDEYELFRQEIIDILDFISNKDKYIEAMQFYKTNKANNINKYFSER